MTDVIGGSKVASLGPFIEGGDVHVRTLLEACLAEVEKSQGIVGGPHELAFREAMVASVRFDQALDSPSTLGVDRDGPEWGNRMYSYNVVTRNGIEVPE